MTKTRFDTKGIKAALKKIQFTSGTFYRAVGEFIWNGYDAGASSLELTYEIAKEKNDGFFRKLQIRDNGKGIRKDHLNKTFEPLFDSEKLDEQDNEEHHSTLHGKLGVGRLTFFTFANFAKWETVYSNDGKNYKYNIEVSAEKMDNFSGIEQNEESTDQNTGTTVIFKGFNKLGKKDIEDELLNYLKKEFCWFLELNKYNHFSLKVNGTDLDYTNLVKDRDKFPVKHPTTGTRFNIKYIQWSSQLNKEYSRFYYLNLDHKEKWKETTKLNNQGDNFHHSVYIESEYFKDFIFTSSADKYGQKTLSGGKRSDDIFEYLNEEIYSYLRKKRKPFLKKHSEIILQEYRDEGIIKVNKTDQFSVVENQELENVFKELYEAQPKIFYKLKNEQKKVFVGFLHLLLKSDKRDKIIDILSEVIKLDDEERNHLLEILKKNKLQKVLQTINLINDRYKTVEILRQLVFRPELNTNERDHIQKVIESNYWLFGEQYHLVSADETFQKSLEKYIYLLDGKHKEVKVDDAYKRNRMDIFICRRWRIPNPNNVKNIIVELKSPKIKLSEEEYFQVTRYKNAILEDPEFKSPLAEWEFILVGNDFRGTFILDQIKNSQNHGEKSLALKVNNFKMYAKTWSQIFDEFDIAHEFLAKSLEIEKKKLVEELSTAEEGVIMAINNTATSS